MEERNRNSFELFSKVPADVNNVYYKETQAVKRRGINEIEEKVYSS